MSRFLRERLSEENLLVSRAASPEGETHLDRCCSTTHIVPEFTCICVCCVCQVNLLPDLMETLSGEGLCHLSGESTA